MSMSVLSGGILIGDISRASVCKFVEFTFIGILKTEHTPKAYRFSTKGARTMRPVESMTSLQPIRGNDSAPPSKARAPAPEFLQFFQVKRLMLRISQESAIDRMARIADRDFA